jgi:hypothetical protein
MRRRRVPKLNGFSKAGRVFSDPVLAFNEVQRHSIQTLSQDGYYRKPHPYLWEAIVLL